MRTINEVGKDILGELGEVMAQISTQQAEDLIREIRRANRIFVAGAGRSRLMIRGMAMRLMHMGFTVYVAGETVTPAIRRDDLLIVASGSGETDTMKILARKAKQEGAVLAVITIFPDSSIGQMADHVLKVPAFTTNAKHNERTSCQPGGNSFEQSVLLIGDALVIMLIEDMKISDPNGELKMRHANLE